ncbi:MAG: hypothetical protein QXT67_04860 [Candidatus Bathyarchaeia archaeon]
MAIEKFKFDKKKITNDKMTKRWISIRVPEDFSNRLDKIIVNATISLSTYLRGVKTVISEWALEEWMDKYENDPNLYNYIEKKLREMKLKPATKRWATVYLSEELTSRFNKIIVNETVKLGKLPFGVQTVIFVWALEEWLSKYENDPNLYNYIEKKLRTD